MDTNQNHFNGRESDGSSSNDENQDAMPFLQEAGYIELVVMVPQLAVIDCGNSVENNFLELPENVVDDSPIYPAEDEALIDHAEGAVGGASMNPVEGNAPMDPAVGGAQVNPADGVADDAQVNPADGVADEAQMHPADGVADEAQMNLAEGVDDNAPMDPVEDVEGNVPMDPAEDEPLMDHAAGEAQMNHAGAARAPFPGIHAPFPGIHVLPRRQRGRRPMPPIMYLNEGVLPIFNPVNIGPIPEGAQMGDLIRRQNGGRPERFPLRQNYDPENHVEISESKRQMFTVLFMLVSLIVAGIIGLFFKDIMVKIEEFFNRIYSYFKE